MTPETKSVPPTYKFECPHCSKSFSGDDLPDIADNVAWHWNKEHNSKLGNRHEKIDTVEMGGHNVHGNDWNVTRIPIYLTSFDVISRLGLEDGRAVQPDGEAICKDCREYLPGESDRVEKAPNAYYPEFLCHDCAEQETVKQKQEENQSLTDF